MSNDVRQDLNNFTSISTISSVSGVSKPKIRDLARNGGSFKGWEFEERGITASDRKKWPEVQRKYLYRIVAAPKSSAASVAGKQLAKLKKEKELLKKKYEGVLQANREYRDIMRESGNSDNREIVEAAELLLASIDTSLLSTDGKDKALNLTRAIFKDRARRREGKRNRCNEVVFKKHTDKPNFNGRSFGSQASGGMLFSDDILHE